MGIHTAGAQGARVPWIYRGMNRGAIMKGRVIHRNDCENCGLLKIVSKDGENITGTCNAIYRGECVRDEAKKPMKGYRHEPDS